MIEYDIRSHIIIIYLYITYITHIISFVSYIRYNRRPYKIYIKHALTCLIPFGPLLLPLPLRRIGAARHRAVLPGMGPSLLQG